MRTDITAATEARMSAAARGRTFYFVRHGATEPNLRKVRCGGDLDVPLTDIGREQVRATAQRLRTMPVQLGAIVCSDLQRTRETATIIADILGIDNIAVEPLLNERHLGTWNLRPIAETEHLLAGNVPPPGGESDEAFTSRIFSALYRLEPYIAATPLIVGSKGVGRVLNGLLGDGGRLQLGNAEIAAFTMPPGQRDTALERICV